MNQNPMILMAMSERHLQMMTSLDPNQKHQPTSLKLKTNDNLVGFGISGTITPEYLNCLQNDLKSAAGRGVRGVFLEIDSGGGYAAGVSEFGDFLREFAASVPVVSYIPNGAFSAAYWIASQSTGIIAHRTASVGSIGVLYVHYDMRKMLEHFGIDATILRRKGRKAEVNPIEPISEIAMASLGKELDATFEVFVEAVATGRGLTIETAKEAADESQIFDANEALERKLIDRTGSRLDALAWLSELVNQNGMEEAMDEELKLKNLEIERLKAELAATKYTATEAKVKAEAESLVKAGIAVPAFFTDQVIHTISGWDQQVVDTFFGFCKMVSPRIDLGIKLDPEKAMKPQEIDTDKLGLEIANIFSD